MNCEVYKKLLLTSALPVVRSRYLPDTNLNYHLSFGRFNVQ